MPDYQALVQRLRGSAGDGCPPYEKRMYLESATAITDLLAQQKVLVEEVEAARETDEASDAQCSARTDEDDDAAHQRFKTAYAKLKAARAATDAAFPGGPPK